MGFHDDVSELCAWVEAIGDCTSDQVEDFVVNSWDQVETLIERIRIVLGE